MNKSIKRTIAAVSMTAMLAAGFALPVSAATQVEVTGNPVMIRADAGLKNTVVSKAYKGDKYVYVGQKCRTKKGFHRQSVVQYQIFRQ